MTDYESLTGADTTNSDFLSMYMSQSSCSSVRAQVSELPFTPSPAKHSHRTYSEHTLDNHNNTGFMNGITSASLLSSSSSSSAPFCTRDTVSQSIKYLNQEVTTLGLASLYEDGAASMVCLVNCCYEFLQKYQRSARLREEMEDRLQRSSHDLEQQQATCSRLRASLDLQQRETASVMERERQTKNKNKLLNNKLKAEKEEVKRLQSVIQHRDAQYKHELKKKEREQTRLKDRLNKLLADKTDRRIGMEIANNLTRIGGKRGKWATNSRQEEELYRGVISTYEEKQKQLMVENHELRQSLTHLQKELVTMLNSPQKQGDHQRPSIDLSDEDSEELEEEREENGSDPNQLSEGVFQMPYELVRDTVELHLKEHCERLQEYIRKLQKARPANTDSDVPAPASHHSPQSRISPDKEEEYRKQIQRYREIIDQQEEMLQAQFEAGESQGAASNGLNESTLWEDKEALDRERQLFQQQQENFHKERTSYTEAAIRLARDRKSFEEEKAAFLSQQFNSLTPFRNDSAGGRRRPVSASAATGISPAQHKRTTSDSESSSQDRQLPCTPSQLAYRPYSTPVGPSIKLSNPSTAELYRKLGLHHHAEGGASQHGGEHTDDDGQRRHAQHVDGVRLNLFKNQTPLASEEGY